MYTHGTKFATLLCVAFLLIQVERGTCQVPGLGKCPSLPVKDGFKLSRYAGKWYEIERYWPIFFELGTKCGQATYTELDNGHIKVENMGFNRISGEVTTVVGDAFAPNTSIPAKLVVTFPQAGVFATGNYWVLDTDYQTYSMVYSCSALDGIAHADIVWILGREKTLPKSTLDKLHVQLKSLNLRTKFLIDPPQTDCPFENEDKNKMEDNSIRFLENGIY